MVATVRTGIVLLVLAATMSLVASPGQAPTGPAAAAGAPGRPAEADTSDTTTVEPYTTDRGVAYHVLAAPAYVLHGATRVLGWGVRLAEQHVPHLFRVRSLPRGVLPLFDLGGPTGFLAGLALFDDHLFGSSHGARIEGLYGGPDTFEARGRYRGPPPLGPGSQFNAEVSISSDRKREFFLDGNDNDRHADEITYSRDQIDATLSLTVAPPDAPWRADADLLYERIQIQPPDGEPGTALRNAAPAGLGTTDLLTTRLTLGTDFTEGRRRTTGGTEVLLQLGYTHDLNANRFRYGQYVIGVRQYLPVGLFPASRRLALRARLEHVEPLFEGSAVPFYQRPALGGQHTLRGFQGRRFQNDGALTLNAEYRYPIWSNADAVLFVDAGQVFHTYAQITADRFHWSYGGGLHLLNQRGLSARLEVAGSTEGLRTILTVRPTFRRLSR